ncbi:MAG: phosphoenolpyruvate synthase [bacterium]|nr:phosphoenolpyruvate synthase [bacterium]
MSKGGQYIYRFEDVDQDNIPEVGGKGANLGEMTKAGFPVPPGFVVSASAYYYFVKENKLDQLIKKELTGLDPEDTKTLQAKGKLLQQAVLKATLPPDLVEQIKQGYKELSAKALQKGGADVAVRSSATAEDLPEASFAGQQATFLNIHGATEVVNAVKRCIASLFEPRAIYYRIVNKFDHLKVALAVPVQVMVQSDISGIMFTADPVNSDETIVVIEAGLGLGEAVVSGSITPDTFHVDKKTLQITKREIHDQTWQITRVRGKDQHVNLTAKQKRAPKIKEDQVLALAKIGLKLEEHYQKPQDSEFAIEAGRVYIVQTRPITTLGNVENATAAASMTPAPAPSGSAGSLQGGVAANEAKALLHGIGASIGAAAGPVVIIHSPEEIDKIKPGDVLVTEMTTPDYVPAMRRAVAIVTDAGGKTSHAAIVSRELGIPCVVGAGTATTTLKNGVMVTVDGHEGTVYQGKVQLGTAAATNGPTGTATAATPSGSAAYNTMVPATGTKVYVNLGEPDMAAETAKLPSDGVGLMRAEFIITGIGEHPLFMIKEGRSKEYIQKLADGIAAIAGAFSPRPVIYRATDFKSNEYAHLKGGESFEKEEANPMIGFRGASRYIRQPEEFALELEAIKEVREKRGFKNLWLMIPFVRTTDELISIKELIRKSGLEQSNEFKLWIMAEVPSVAILAEQFCQLGIDGMSIGSNDLTQLVLGVDRDNGTLAADFDERNPAVLMAIEHIARTCRQYNVTCSICGQAASDYAEVVECLVRAGATSVSVSPDRVVDTRKLIASVEKRMLLEHTMGEQDEHLL